MHCDQCALRERIRKFSTRSVEAMAIAGGRGIGRCRGMAFSGVGAAAVLCLVLIGVGSLGLCAAELKNCSFSAVYSFGDSLTDNGNAIAALPEQFIDSEENPNGVNFPHHAADRYCDGRLLVDYIGRFLRLLLVLAWSFAFLTFLLSTLLFGDK